MGTFFLENDPTAPYCACGTLCDGRQPLPRWRTSHEEYGSRVADERSRRGWCVSCEEWASDFGLPEIDPMTGQEFRRLLRYCPFRIGFFEWDPVADRWADAPETHRDDFDASAQEG